MLSLDEQYPEYCFKKHKGYGTKLHYEKIREFGISPVHRKTFFEETAGGVVICSAKRKSPDLWGEIYAARFMREKRL